MMSNLAKFNTQRLKDWNSRSKIYWLRRLDWNKQSQTSSK